MVILNIVDCGKKFPHCVGGQFAYQNTMNLSYLSFLTTRVWFKSLRVVWSTTYNTIPIDFIKFEYDIVDLRCMNSNNYMSLSITLNFYNLHAKRDDSDCIIRKNFRSKMTRLCEIFCPHYVRILRCQLWAKLHVRLFLY